MNYKDEDSLFDAKFELPVNTFIKGKHPDKCPDCGKEPIISDLNVLFSNDELWLAQCKCHKPNIRAVTGDSIPEVVENWDKMLKAYKAKER